MNPLAFAGLWPRLTLGGILLALLAAGGWYLHHKGFQSGYGKAKAQWEAATAEAGARFNEALVEQQRTLAKADRGMTDVRRDTRARREELDAALETPDGDAWGDARIPGAVAKQLNAVTIAGKRGASNATPP